MGMKRRKDVELLYSAEEEEEGAAEEAEEAEEEAWSGEYGECSVRANGYSSSWRSGRSLHDSRRTRRSIGYGERCLGYTSLLNILR